VKVGKRTFSGHAGKVNALSFSPDGNYLLAATGITGLRGEAVLWNLKTGKPDKTFSEGHRDILYGAIFSPDGKTIATAGYDRRIQLWEAHTGKLLRTLEGHNGPVHDIAFSPEGTVLASAGGDSAVKLWLIKTGERLDTFGQPTGEQFVTVFSPDSHYVAAAGADKQIRLWRWVSKTSPQINPLARVRFAHEDEIIDLAISPDGTRLASTSADLTIKVWSMPKLELVQKFDNQPDVVSVLAFERTGKTLHLARLDGSTAQLRLKNTARQTVTQQGQTLRSITQAKQTEATEKEPNNVPAKATPITLPAKITGTIHDASGVDQDLFRFQAKAGEQWILEINAGRSKSPLDSKVEVLTTEGEPIERMRLQSVQESWLTFRGKNSDTSGDFRLFKWDEMNLNQYLYVKGEVVKLWHYPRGPDSGYIVYPGTGNRRGFFDTTPLAHPLGQPAYIVQPRAPDTPPIANGLPMFTLYYENDDESRRRWGKDSRLTFTVPTDGQYLARVSDIRQLQGESFKYTLTIRPRRPGFTVTLGGIAGGGVPKGSGREFSVSAQRIDDYEGPIRVDISDVPKGFTVTTPLIIEAGQERAFGAVYAAADAPTPEKGKEFAKVTASAILAGKIIKHPVNNLDKLKPLAPAKLKVSVLPAKGEPAQNSSLTKPLELTIAPSQTILARVRIERNGTKGRVSFGSHDSGRNLPFGAYVDNIGLNGLMIVEGQNERGFYITADKVTAETTRRFHLKANVEGGILSQPILLHVRK
jgi:WD40 repeat protein